MSTDTILVCYDKDNGVLVVGRKRMNESIEVINALKGTEATELYEKLVARKEK